MTQKLLSDFFTRDVLTIAPDILGKILVRKFENGNIERYIITEVEAYRGTEDLACHASKGKTPRTQVMFKEGGLVYVYLIYGMYWMLNIVTGHENDASAILIRSVEGTSGPGRIGKLLQLDRSFYGENLQTSNRLWIEDSNIKVNCKTSTRIGIQYAGESWISKPWRFTAEI